LQEHYDGPGEIDKSISLARTQIKELFYKNEQTFSFEKFIAKLNDAFQMLAECHEDLMEKNKVDHMITAMLQCTNSAIIAATTMILTNPEMQNNFLAAANKMTEVIANIFPAIQLHCQGRNVSSLQKYKWRQKLQRQQRNATNTIRIQSIPSSPLCASRRLLAGNSDSSKNFRSQTQNP
jgi:hypothetical protein